MKILFCCSCFLGLLWQSYQVIKVYADNEVITEISMNKFKTIEMPKITLCLDLCNIFRPEFQGDVEKIVYNMSVPIDDLNSFLLDDHEIFKEINVLDQEMEMRNMMKEDKHFLRKSLMKTFFASYFQTIYSIKCKCFEFRFNGRFNYLEQKEWLSIKVSEGNFFRILLFFPGISLHGSTFDAIGTTKYDSSSENIQMTELIETRSLPKPFKYACRDFESEGFLDDLDCILKCRMKIVTRGKTFSGYLPQTVDSIARFHLYANQSENYDEIFERTCPNICAGVPCVKREAKIGLWTNYEDSVHYRFRLLSTKNIIMRPKTTLVETTFLVHQIISAWLGFHLLVVYNIFSSIQVKVLNSEILQVRKNIFIYNLKIIHIHMYSFI